MQKGPPSNGHRPPSLQEAAGFWDLIGLSPAEMEPLIIAGWKPQTESKVMSQEDPYLFLWVSPAGRHEGYPKVYSLVSTHISVLRTCRTKKCVRGSEKNY